MKRHRSVASIVGIALGTCVALGAQPAQAETSEWVKVYDVEGDPKVGKLEVAGVAKKCDFHMMSRMGPDPREVAACEAAAQRLSVRGAAAVPAMLAALDREDLPFGARDRLYAALARTGDAAVAEKMIDAMAKIATARSDQRTYEATEIEAVAEAILHATPEERAPWIEAPQQDDHERLTHRVFAWRGHLRDTAGKTREQRAADRLSRAHAEKGHPDLEKAYLAVKYLLSRDPAAARAAAEALVERVDEAPAAAREATRRSVESLRRSAEYQVREAAEAAARASKKSPPAGKAAAAKKTMVPPDVAPPKPRPDDKSRS